jgi:hypothetical protein
MSKMITMTKDMLFFDFPQKIKSMQALIKLNQENSSFKIKSIIIYFVKSTVRAETK